MLQSSFFRTMQQLLSLSDSESGEALVWFLNKHSSYLRSHKIESINFVEPSICSKHIVVIAIKS